MQSSYLSLRQCKRPYILCRDWYKWLELLNGKFKANSNIYQAYECQNSETIIGRFLNYRFGRFKYPMCKRKIKNDIQITIPHIKCFSNANTSSLSKTTFLSRRSNNLPICTSTNTTVHKSLSAFQSPNRPLPDMMSLRLKSCIIPFMRILEWILQRIDKKVLENL